ncbi:MAG: hypothetical protein HCAMLNBO_02054 [Candidatus Brocadia fulgida]|nr:hypothetical protein [Candidatus Brocadia fulgida]
MRHAAGFIENAAGKGVCQRMRPRATFNHMHISAKVMAFRNQPGRRQLLIVPALGCGNDGNVSKAFAHGFAHEEVAELKNIVGSHSRFCHHLEKPLEVLTQRRRTTRRKGIKDRRRRRKTFCAKRILCFCSPCFG